MGLFRFHNVRTSLSLVFALGNQFGQSPHATETRSEAVGYFRDHRLGLGLTEPHPSIDSISAQATTRGGRLHAMADRIRGIEQGTWPQPSQENSAPNLRLAADLYRGKEEIDELYETILGNVDHLRHSTSKYSSDEKKDIQMTVATMAFGAFIAPLFPASPHPIWQSPLALISGLISGGLLARRAFLTHDFDFHTFSRRISDFTFSNKKVPSWSYQGWNYSLPGDPNKLEEIFNHKPVDPGSIAAYYLARHTTPFFPRKKSALWIGIDTLFSRDSKTDEPTLAMAVRFNAGPPKYAQKEKASSPLAVLLPAAIRNQSP